MKNVVELNLGFSDAQNYSQRQNKEVFNSIFVRNRQLDSLLNPNVYFLVGEKGTGKTAYATYLSNNNYKETKSIINYLSATDYEKFVVLKQKNNLDLSGYVEIWKAILLLLLAKTIKDKDRRILKTSKNTIDLLNDAIDEYYLNAFSPEIISVMRVMDESDIVAGLISKHLSAKGGVKEVKSFSESRFQHNLYYIVKSFSDAFSSLKLNRNVVLFIDGIDIRPDTITYSEYLDCIRGLADAAWNLNTNLFQGVKDSTGRIRIVLLLRPDIFHSLNMQNETNKLLDNSVFLDWRTTYESYKSSDLYMVAKKILMCDQADEGFDIFEYYFPWDGSISKSKRTAFMEFLRISLSRPRDILVIMQLLKRMMEQKGMISATVFDKELFYGDDFQNKYSEYFISSLKDQLSFYYSNEDFNHFLKLFDFFDRSDFTYEEFDSCYNQFIEYILDNADDIPEFIDEKRKLLQLLYDSNLIAAVEEEGKYFHFSYREKDGARISPEVPVGEGITYRFHYGLYKKTKNGRY